MSGKITNEVIITKSKDQILVGQCNGSVQYCIHEVLQAT